MNNFSFANFVIGIIGIIVGTLVLKEAFHINHHIYFLDFVERKYGPGSGTTAYRLIGLGVCILSILVMVGIIDMAGSQSAVQSINLNKTNNTSPTYYAPTTGNNNIAK
ncbi:MAG: hypothetical protein H7230_02600 [Candidatus Parcubacteria bacterium]|nr:hypothetical protein [Candidatus Paceibacterota bacterium]